MAIEVTSEILHDGARNVVMQFTGRSDGAGQEAGVVKVDVSELQPPPETVKVERVEYAVTGGIVKLSWAANSAVVFAVLSGQGEFDYCNIDGMVNSAGEGRNGDILLTTEDFELNSAYTIKLDMVKKF